MFMLLSLDSCCFKAAMKELNLIKAFHNFEDHLAHGECVC